VNAIHRPRASGGKCKELRPNYAQALQYLGEAYVLLGEINKARALHARLQPLDPQMAQLLASAIDQGGAIW
jgi:hypothetical protein